MKKIITLILAAGLFTTAAFAQDRRHSYDNRYNENSYQNQYPAKTGYNFYGSNSYRGRYADHSGYSRYNRYRDARMMYRHHRYYNNRYYNNYRDRKGVSFQIVIGSRRRF